MTHEQKKSKEEIKNPGIALKLNEKCTNTFPVLFDGFRVISHKALSRHFRATYSIYLSSITPGNFRFGTTYVGDKEISINERSPVMFGDTDSRGNMNASIYHRFGSRLKVRFDAQMENRNFATSQLTAHYFGNNYTFSTILVNVDAMKNSGCLLVQFLQNVTTNLALGAELACIKNMSNFKNPTLTIPKYVDSQVAVLGRYTTPHTVWSTVLSLNNILVCCYKQASEQLDFGMELNTNFRSNESVGSLAFKVTVEDRGLICKGYIDSNTNVGSVFEKRICNTPFSLSVSTNLNHRSNNFRLGLGFIIE